MRYEAMTLSEQNLFDVIHDAAEGGRSLGAGTRLIAIVDDSAGIIAYALDQSASTIINALNAQEELSP